MYFSSGWSKCNRAREAGGFELAKSNQRLPGVQRSQVMMMVMVTIMTMVVIMLTMVVMMLTMVVLIV